MAYIYHNKELDDYWIFNNLKRLSDEIGISYDNLTHWFSREEMTRVNRDNWVVVKVEPVKRKGSK